MTEEGAISDLTAVCQRQLEDQIKNLVESADSADAAKAAMKLSFDNVAGRKVTNCLKFILQDFVASNKCR